MLQQGHKLGNYEILDTIGVGGMGTVYRACHTVLGRIDAIKVLAPNLTAQTEFQQRFLNEAKIQARLRHPSIAEVYDCFQFEGQYCISMEYVNGTPLSRVLATGVLPEARLRRIFRQVLEAMAFSHRLNIVHRDLKPSNILLSPQDDVKVVDFGIAKMLDDKLDLTAAHDRVGTTRYMAPEQILGQPVTAASDVYALGVLLMEACTGQVPFDKGSDYETKRSHLHEPAPSARSVAPHVGDDLARLIARCLAKKPSDRPADARALLEAFDRIGNPYCATPERTASDTASDGRVEPFPPSRITGVRAGAGRFVLPGLLLALLAVAAGWFLWTRRPSGPAEQPPAPPAEVEVVEREFPASSTNIVSEPPPPPATNAVPVLVSTNEPQVPDGETNLQAFTLPTTPPAETNLVEIPVTNAPPARVTLHDVIIESERLSEMAIAPQMITVESTTASWDNYPRDWRITFYAPDTATKRRTVVWEDGRLARIIYSASPPLVNNQRLSFSFNSLKMDSDVILQKCNEYALERGWQVERIKLRLEKAAEDALNPVWRCELFANNRRLVTLTFSSQTGEIISAK